MNILTRLLIFKIYLNIYLFPMKMMTSNEKQTKIYRKKYHFMKLQVKSLIIENAALCDEVAKIQENIQIVKEERKFLLRKLLDYENEADMGHSFYSHEQLNLTNGSKTKPKKRRSFEEGSKNV